MSDMDGQPLMETNYTGEKDNTSVAPRMSNEEWIEFLRWASAQDLPRETRGTGMNSVQSPNHYNSGEIECIDYIVDKGFGIGFCAGNAIKYLTRFQHKGAALEDVKKARQYCDFLIKILEEQ